MLDIACIECKASVGVGYSQRNHRTETICLLSNSDPQDAFWRGDCDFLTEKGNIKKEYKKDMVKNVFTQLEPMCNWGRYGAL